MKVVSEEKDFSLIEFGIDRAIDRSKVFPDRVFRGTLKYFLFITFDELFMTMFFNHIKEYLSKIGESDFWLVTIEPDPRRYFAHNFKFYGAFEFSRSDDEKDYVSALSGFPEESPADALMHNSNSLIILSSSNKWAIFGNRDADIAVCAFSDRGPFDEFRSLYGSDLLNGVKAAAEYAYGASGDTLQIDEFCKNYYSE
jgi:hypothetical protein